MTIPLYVLLPEGVEWVPLDGTTAQRSSPVRWYLRQQMPEAATQTAVLVAEEPCVAQVVARAQELGGIAIDAQTQLPVEPSVAHDARG